MQHTAASILRQATVVLRILHSCGEQAPENPAAPSGRGGNSDHGVTTMVTYSGTCPNCGPHETCGHCFSYRQPVKETRPPSTTSDKPTYSGTCPHCGPHETCMHCMSYRRLIRPQA